NITSDDDIHPSQDVANFAEIFPNGSLQTITTIPTIHTVTKNTTCTTPLLLTQEQQLYVECDLQNPVVPGNHVATRSYLYRIDLSKKSFSLETTCDNTWESKVTCY
ncbi:MAG TPA: hypothetical protein VLF89_01695, partial [Candidatus Saccharimonadales bacterium]|nr:hypothetical protein [Candidatus Saccharimonadales bacterium]